MLIHHFWCLQNLISFFSAHTRLLCLFADCVFPHLAASRASLPFFLYLVTVCPSESLTPATYLLGHVHSVHNWHGMNLYEFRLFSSYEICQLYFYQLFSELFVNCSQSACMFVCLSVCLSVYLCVSCTCDAAMNTSPRQPLGLRSASWMLVAGCLPADSNWTWTRLSCSGLVKTQHNSTWWLWSIYTVGRWHCPSLRPCAWTFD